MAEKSEQELYQTVILASIVEREYRVEEEAPLIASVFSNRLRHNIGLYSCATIVYILTEIEGRPHPDRILLEDTKIDSPYNTYMYYGLPPTPVSNPTVGSIIAAIEPAETTYYYFCSRNDGSGEHVFAETLEEHQKNVATYLRK